MRQANLNVHIVEENWHGPYPLVIQSMQMQTQEGLP